MPSASDLIQPALPLGAVLSFPSWGLGLIVAAVGLALLMPYATKVSRSIGAALAALGLGLFFWALPWEAQWLTKTLFYVLSAVTLVGAVAAVSSRAAIYCAVWFAASLLGVAGLLVLNGAQFLGIATIVVYAGAIVVTFLFVLMLAQPQGNESYDRVSWGSASRPFAVFAAGALVAASLATQQEAAQDSLREQVAATLAALPESADYPKLSQSDVVSVRYVPAAEAERLQIELRPTIFPALPTTASQASEQPEVDQANAEQNARKSALAKAFAAAADDRGLDGFQVGSTEVEFLSAHPINDTLTTRHVEALGVNLFGNHLVAIQVAGVLLLTALVGAISILAQDAPASRREEAAT
jgi:NADH-quinone oxidoreductase subunit J